MTSVKDRCATALLAGIALSLPGCVKNHVHPLHARARIDQPGDSLYYDAQVTFKSSEHKTLFAGNTSMKVNLKEATFNGRKCLDYITVRTAPVQGKTEQLSQEDFYFQDASGARFELGHRKDSHSAPRALVKPTQEAPSEMKAGQTFSYRELFEDGRVASGNFTVERSEEITVPAGTFMAWRVSYSRTGGQGEQLVGTQWVAPQVGIIKSADTAFPKSDHEIKEIRFETALQWTNIPLD